MAQARAFLRAFTGTVSDLPGVMNRLNDSLSRDMSQGRFMSLVVIVIDRETGPIEWSNAGHPPALLLRPSTGEVERLMPQGRVLGVLAGAGFEAAEPCTMEEGDVLLLYTDGATEARNPAGEMLDDEGLVEVLRGLAEKDAEGILDGVHAALVDWTRRDEFGDDLTLLALTRRRATP
jgi:sigma-B regulation protein RsbU (phosphoserine phosphatase)